MVERFLRRFVSAAALTLAVLTFALAGDQICFGQAAAINGQIEGTITDPDGAVVPNAAVDIANTETGLSRTLQTNESGFFRAPVLPLGTYTLTVKANGFAPNKRENIILNAGATATLNIQLSVEGVGGEQVLVSSAAPVIEPGRTDLGSTLSANQVQNLPLPSRNTYNYILVQPNVSGHPQTTFGVPRKVNANGFLGRINYQFDGSNNTQSDRAGIRLIPISNTFVGEVQQVNNGFAPEFGNTVGTVYNAVTKSGTNELHGEAGYFIRRKGLNARSTVLQATAPKPPGFLDSVYTNIGGRIIRDKLFFFAAFEYVRHDLSTAVAVTPAQLTAIGLPTELSNAVPTVEKPSFFLGKGDYQINSAHRLSFRYNYFRNEQPFNNGGGLTLQPQTILFQDRAHAVGAQLISLLSANAINEMRFQTPYRDQQNSLFEASGTGPAITISGIANFGAPTVAGFNFIEVTPEISNNFSYNYNTHSFKIGGSIRNIRDDNTAATFAQYTFPSVLAYRDALTAAAGNVTLRRGYATFTQTFGDPQLKYRSNFYSVFGQDTWKARPNLTFVYGLRYDLYDIPDAREDSPFPASRDFKIDKNNFGPRIGVAYALGQDQKTVVRASGGLFYDAPQTDVYRRAILNNGAPQFFNISVNNAQSFSPLFPAVFTSVPSGFNLGVIDITTVAPEFSNLYTSNLNLQVSRELTQDIGLNVAYLFTKGTRLPVYRNINLIPSGATLADGRPIFGSGRINRSFNNILQAESVGNSNYNGMNVTLNRRLSRGYELFATYTYSHAIDDAPEQNNLDSGALLLSDTTNRRRDRGNSLSDRRHAFTFSGVVNPSFDVENKTLGYLANNNRLSFVFRTQSGDIFNIGSNRALNGDPTVPNALQRPLFVGRNTLRGPQIVQLDMRYARQFNFTERLRLEFLVEGSNVLNHSNITGLNSTAFVTTTGAIQTPPSQLANAALGPREVQFGVRFTY